MKRNLSASHHTIADWDFQRGANARSLDPSYYISPPTSLKFTTDPSLGSNTILCRIPETLCLPQGEVRTWLRRDTPYIGPTPGSFRNQAALGGASIANCYFFYMQYAFIVLYRSINNAWTEIYTWDWPEPDNVWYHFRTFWYNGKTPAEVPALCVDLYREIAGEWVKQGDTAYDTANWWKDSEINRCGPFCYVGTNRQSWFDDTEIWGPV